MAKEKNNKNKLYIIIAAIIIIIILLLIFLLPHKYNVELLVGNSVYYEGKVQEGSKIKDLKIPKKTGYEFVGWYYKDKKYDINKKITKDIKLEAKFVKKKYTITIDLDNGSSILTKEVPYKEKLQKPQTPVRVGYKFLGWFVGDNEFDFSTEINSNINITAKWQKLGQKKTDVATNVATNNAVSKKEEQTATYKVEHYLMDTKGDYPSSANITETKEVKLGSIVIPSVKSFIGFITPNAKEVVVSDDSLVVKYYYERKQYELIVNKTKGVKDVTLSPSKDKYYYNEEVNVASTAKEGYHLLKHNDKTSSKDDDFNYEIIDGENAVTIDSKGHTFTVTYYDENNELSSMNPSTFIYGESISLSKSTITKEPYTLTLKNYNGKNKDEIIKVSNVFVGWKTSSDSSEIVYADEDDLNDYVPSACEDELKLYAVFKTQTYDLVEPTLAGYTFAGFKHDGKLINEDEYKDYKITEDDEITISWDVVTYNVTFDVSGVSGATCKDCKESTYTIEDTKKLPTVTKDGYTFNGWVKNGTDEVITEIEEGNYGDLNLTLDERSFTANTNTPYKVEYYYMDTNGNYKTSADETINEKGTTDTTPIFTPTLKDGFEEPKLKQKADGDVLDLNTIKIKGDESTVLKYYFERKQFVVQINQDNGVESVTLTPKKADNKYYFEEKVKVVAAAKDGYHLLSESESNYDVINGENIITINSKGNSFTVNYHKEDGTTSDMVSDNFVYGEDYQLSTNTIIKEDYTLTLKNYNGKENNKTVSIKNNFIGWATSKNGEKVYVDNDAIADYVPKTDGDKLDLYALFETDTYTLEEPTLTGYTFKNFTYEGKEIDKKYYENYKITKDNQEIITNWDLVNYKITYDTKGVAGVTCKDCEESTYNIEENKTLPTPEKAGYTFNGWVAEGKQELLKEIPKGNFGELSLSLSEESFTANKDTQYKIEYYYMDNKGHYKEEADYTTSLQGTTDTQIEFEPEKKDKGFKDPVLKESAEGEKIEELPTIDGHGTTVLKYYYERKQFTLTVNTTTGIKDFTVDSEAYNKDKKYYYEEEVSITSTAKEGYHLLSHELLKTELTNNDKTETFTYTIIDGTNEVTLNSASDSFTVIYHDENGLNEKEEQKTYYEGITLDDNTYEKDPYTLTIKHAQADDEESTKEIEFNNEFIGWSTSNGSTDVTYQDGALIIPESDGQEINLYAVFKTEKKDIEKLSDTEDYYFKDFEDDGKDIEESKLKDYTIQENEEITAHWLEVTTLTDFDKLIMDGIDSSFASKVYEDDKKVTAYINGAKQKFTSFVPKLMPFTGKIQSALDQGEQGIYKEIYITFDGRKEFLFSSSKLSSELIQVVGMQNSMSNIHNKNAKVRVILNSEKAITKDRKNELDYTINFQALVEKENIDESGTKSLSVFNKTKPDLDLDSRDSGQIIFRYNDPEATTYDAIFQMGVNTAIHKFFENEFIKNIEVTFMDDITFFGSDEASGINGKTMIVDRTNLDNLTWAFNSDINKFGGIGSYNYPVSKLYADGDDAKRYKLKVKVNLYVDTDKTMPTEYEILFAPVEKITYNVNYQKNGTGENKKVTCTVGEECVLEDIVNVVTYYDNISKNPTYIIPKLTSCKLNAEDCQNKIQLKNQEYVIVENLTDKKNQEFTLNTVFESEKLPSQDKNARGSEYVFGGFSKTNDKTDLQNNIIGYKAKANPSFIDEYEYSEPSAEHTYQSDTTLYAVWWEKPYIDSISFGLYDGISSLQGEPKQTSATKVSKDKKAFYIEIPENDLIVYVPNLIVKTTTSIKLNPIASAPNSTYAELWSTDNRVHIGDFSMAALPLNEEDNGKTWKASDDGMFGMAYQYVQTEVPYPFSGSQFYKSLKNGITIHKGNSPTFIPITGGKELGVADKFGCNGLACTPHYGSMVSEHINGKTYFFFATDENISSTHTITYKIGNEEVCKIIVPNNSPIPKISDENGNVTYNGKTYNVTNWNFDFENKYATSDIVINGEGTKN